MSKYKKYFNYSDDKLYNTGIYKISFGTEKCYIGSALVDKNYARARDDAGFYTRWKHHLYMLENNKHGNLKLQRAFNKYGLNVMKFEIIDILKPHYHKLYYDIIETGYIAKYNAVKNGYNILPKGGSKRGIKLDDSTKEKISKANKGVKNGNYGKHGKNHPSSKPFYQYDLNGKFIKEWESMKEAEKVLNLHLSNYNRAKRKGKDRVGNFRWSREYFSEGLKSEFNCNIK